MRETFLVDPDLAAALGRAGIRTARDLLALAGTGAERSVTTFVDLPVEGTSGRFYLKRYHYPGWRTSKGLVGRGSLWGRAPELHEFLALRRLRALGVPAVRPVAAAAQHQRGRLVGHGLLTEAVPGAAALDARLLAAGDPLRTAFALRRRVAEEMGRTLRRMHDATFVHRDCHARNVLVRAEDGDACIWWLDCRRARFPRSTHRSGSALPLRAGALRDLGTLDRDLRGLMTRGERRRALAAYLGDDAALAKDAVRRIAALRARLPPPRRPRAPAD
jgi:hypothetical protein